MAVFGYKQYYFCIKFEFGTKFDSREAQQKQKNI